MVDLLVGPLVLGLLGAGHQTLPGQPVERRVDGAEAGLEEVAIRAFKLLLDLVSRGPAFAEDTETKGANIHGLIQCADTQYP